MEIKAVVILDTYNEAGHPVIGTVLCKGHSRTNIGQRIREAIERHFDSKGLKMDIPWYEIERNESEQFEIEVSMEEGVMQQTIEIYQTEVY